MTTEQKRPLIFTGIDLLTFTGFYFFMTATHEPMLTLSDELQFWSGTLLLLVPTLICARILLYLLFSIGNTLVSGKREDKFLIDEFGKLVKLKAIQNFGSSFMLGFLLILVFLYFGASITLMFSLFFWLIFVAFVVHNLSVFYYIKKGI